MLRRIVPGVVAACALLGLAAPARAQISVPFDFNFSGGEAQSAPTPPPAAPTAALPTVQPHVKPKPQPPQAKRSVRKPPAEASRPGLRSSL